MIRKTIATLLLCFPIYSYAGQYQEALSKCLLNSTDSTDRKTLARWIFATVASNPSVSDMSRLTPEQLASVSKDAAGVFQKLIADKCPQESRDAISEEGATAFKGAFETLGAVAGQSLMADPSVAQAMTLLDKSIDKEKIIKSIMKTKPIDK